jgi:biopolymer transport protein ExbD
MTVGNRKGIMAEMNVVPLIDVLLVLLIIFMVITPLTPRGLEALIPQPNPDAAPSASPQNDSTIVVQVAGEGRVLLNQQEIGWEALGPRLAEIFKERGQRAAFVQGEESVEFREVARAIDIMRTAGVESVGLLTPQMFPQRAAR